MLATRLHVSDSTTYKIANQGTAANPSLRGAIETSVNGGNITGGLLSGTGVTAANFGPMAPGTGTTDFTLTAAKAGILSDQAVHVANNFGNVREQSAQRFEPADKPAAAFRSRLPPRAARRHDDNRRRRAIGSRDCDDNIARSGSGSPARRDEACRRPVHRGSEHRVAGLARELDCRCPMRLAEALRIQEPKARPRAVAQDDQAAMRRVAAQLFVIRGIDADRRQLGDADRGIRADDAQGAADAIRRGGGSIEKRYAEDARSGTFEIGLAGIQAIHRAVLA